MKRLVIVYHIMFAESDVVFPPLGAMLLKTVMIVDTSNEIAGDGDIPHREAIGESRRIMVPNKKEQHRCLSTRGTTNCRRLVYFRYILLGLNPARRSLHCFWRV